MTITLEAPTQQAVDVGNAVCHLFAEYGNAPRSRCGVPRSEQPPHLVHGSWAAATCAGCGLPRCPTCREMHLRQ